jgi:hypothetical protein
LKEQTDNQTLAKQYLLGTLSGAELDRLEERYFSDNELFEDIGIAEDELIDAYVRGRLAPLEREQFEKVLTRSQRLSERVHYGRLLRERASSWVAPSPRSWWNALIAPWVSQGSALRSAAVPAVIVVVLGGFVLIFGWMQLRNETQRLAAERLQLEQKQKDFERRVADLTANTDQLSTQLQQEKAEAEKLNQQLQEAREQLAQSHRQPGVPEIASIVLLSGLSRSPADAPELVVSSREALIRLELVLDFDEFARYDASIQSADNREFLSRRRLRTRGPAAQRTISIEFPSRLLPEGNYVVKISGRSPSGSNEAVAGYRFRLVK